MDTTSCWLAVVDDTAARSLARGRWRSLVVASPGARDPGPGDRLAVVRTHRPSYMASAALVGTADVRARGEGQLEIRHRVVAPEAHVPTLADVKHLRIAAGWTNARLGALVGTIVPLDANDHARIEAAIRERALAYGPAPTRPAHRMPRTPGRRALIVPRMLRRRLPSARYGPA